jgi:hypothetical protein
MIIRSKTNTRPLAAFLTCDSEREIAAATFHAALLPPASFSSMWLATVESVATYPGPL